jgi:alpha-L-fucosidase
MLNQLNDKTMNYTQEHARLLQEKTGRILGLILLILTLSIHAGAQCTYDPYANETKEQRDERMAWWREARFGMFIHWGVYAVPAGTYNGEQIPGIGEWIMLRGQIPVKEYKAYADQFNPVNYDPKAWARLARKAGMRYMVITSKHHDGFALFPSAVTDWDVADATPYGKDLIGPLEQAARNEGLRFGLYYSQAQDWNHPGGAKARYEEGTGWDPLQDGDFDAYINRIAIPQVGEILSRYRPDILWWDTPRWMNEARAERLIPLIRIVPGIITNNRLGGGYEGDTNTPEQHIPASGYKDRDWEVCMTMNGTWGYKSYDHNWKSTEDLIKKLCDIASKGGNFLLNVGPTPEGEIPQPSIDRLEEIGAWMDINGEAIYGTTANPLAKLQWGRCTKKIDGDQAILYLHVFDWPENGRLLVNGLRNLPVSASLLDGGKKLKVNMADEGLIISVPRNAPDDIVSVIKLEIHGEIQADPVSIKQEKNGNIDLTDEYMADVHLHGDHGGTARLLEENGQAYFGRWTDYRCWVGWTFRISQPGTFEVIAEVGGNESTTLDVGIINGEMNRIEITPAAEPEGFERISLGTISLPEEGVYELQISPVSEETWKPVTLRNVELKKVK